MAKFNETTKKIIRIEEMDINLMTIEEFRALPESKDWHNQDVELFDSLIILPADIYHFSVLFYFIKLLIAKIFRLEKPPIYSIAGLHDSGYRLMDFVACKGHKPICRLSGWGSDVLEFDGIGGFGYNWSKKGGVPKTIPSKGWKIDCLRTSGLLRLFKSPKWKLKAGEALSRFEIFAIEAKKDEKQQKSNSQKNL